MRSAKTINRIGFYNFHNLSDSKRLQALDYFSGCYKTLSIIYLRMLDLPVLKGVAVVRWDEYVRQEVLGLFNTWGLSSVLVRTDKKAETGRYMRGGYVTGIGELDKEVNTILGAGRIVILLEPKSPYQDLYSLNAMFWPEEEDILLEVVGPGFDASDLNRGDITPHETIYLPRQKYPSKRVLSEKDIKRTVVKPKGYELSVRLRLAKIGRLLIDRSNWLSYDLSTDVELESQGREHLQRIGQTLLLEYEERYRPIPISLLRTVYRYIVDLPERAKQMKINGEPMVVSMSFFAPDKDLAFWDIVWPSLKYTVEG